jgi:hypothetical protein
MPGCYALTDSKMKLIISIMFCVSIFSASASAQNPRILDDCEELLTEENAHLDNLAIVSQDDHVPTDHKPCEGKVREKFHWKPALVQSGLFLGVQHGFRVLAQESTRSQLDGPFFRDWGRTVKNLRGWDDGNSFFINYVAHTLQGAVTGRIFVTNSDRANKQTFGKSKQYWQSRLKALAWSTAWSAQFELGPVSEASIGNVGLRPKPSGHSGMAYVDLVVTPVLGTSLLIAEDAIDKYVLKNWLERKGRSRRSIKILRSFLTPTTTIGNVLRLKVPWKRNRR